MLKLTDAAYKYETALWNDAIHGDWYYSAHPVEKAILRHAKRDAVKRKYTRRAIREEIDRVRWEVRT